jgi:hypothetical protein
MQGNEYKMKIRLETNKISVYFFAVFVFLILAGFFYGNNVPQAKADNEDVTQYGVVFDGTNGSGTPNYARIIRKDGVYHMWYEDTASHFFYHTTSNDGKHWQEGQITLANNVHEPSVIWDSDDSKYKLWFEPTIGLFTGQIWYAESSDGIAWDPPQPVTWTDGDNDWENDGRYMPYVIKEDGTYKMWYQSLSDVAGEGGDRRINYATSDDGLAWNNSAEFHQVTFDGNENNNIVLGLGDNGSWDSASLYTQAIIRLPLEADWNYMMLYASHDGGRYKIGRAVSDDGFVWMKDDDYLISNEFDIWFPSIIEENDGFFIWYMDSTEGKVYFATLPFGGQQEDDDNHSGVNWNRYKHYKDEYKSDKNKGRYFTVRQIKKENPTLFWELRSIYLRYKALSHEELEQLSLDIQEKFKLFEGYHGYKKYRELKEKVG